MTKFQQLAILCLALGLIATGCDDDEKDDVDSAGDAGDDGGDGGDDQAYPEGPYGFKGSMMWTNGGPPGQWSDQGDVIPNVCLPDTNDEEVCLGDYYLSEEYDVLIVDFTAMWCPPCNYAATSEHAFLEFLEERGWSPKWISVVEQDTQYGFPDLSDAQYWQTHYDLGTVLYDGSSEWLNDVMNDVQEGDGQRGFPTIFFVHTTNMLIWDTVSGWVDPDDGYWDQFVNGIAYVLQLCASSEES